MTESEWLACTDTQQLYEAAWARLSDRKLRLLVCTIARRLAPGLDSAGQRALDRAEAYADGAAPWADLVSAVKATTRDFDALGALRDHLSEYGRSGDLLAASLVACLANDELLPFPLLGPAEAEDEPLASGHALFQSLRMAVGIVRDMIEYPGRRTVCDPAWLGWRTGLLRSMAEEIYERRSFDEVPVLADALEEAGCTDPAILDHLRNRGMHNRGCWVLDLLLDREPEARQGLLLLRGPRTPPYTTVARPVKCDPPRRHRAGRLSQVWLRLDPWPDSAGVVFGVDEPVARELFPQYMQGILAAVRRTLAAAETSQRTFGRLRITMTGAQAHAGDTRMDAFAQATARTLASALESASLVSTP
jgi:hypothetical protein